jgi:GMP synthase-like glutamine amidotransferase
MGRILAERGIETEVHVILEDPDNPNTQFPSIENYDGVIAFGSFCNAHDPAVRHWVEPEIALISSAVETDTPYLGVCFGGQLLAEALGGSVAPAPEGMDEIGLIEFESDVLPSGPWFSWHEDRYELPADVEVLGTNANAIQLFRKGKAVGTQFHPEAELPLVSMWTEVGADHIPERTTADEIHQDLIAHHDALESNCRTLIDWFLSDVVAGGAPDNNGAHDE